MVWCCGGSGVWCSVMVVVVYGLVYDLVLRW